MRTEMKIERLQPLIIGHEADNLTGIVEVDCTAWMTAYPELTRYTLAVTPPDGTPYFVPAEMEGTILRWIVRREDTASAGEGSYQIIATGENGEQKSTDFYPLYICRNMPGLDGASETPPEAALAWVSKVLNAAERAEDAARRAENAGGSGEPGGAVNSVNGKTGAVQLTAADVGAANAKETTKAINELYEENAERNERICELAEKHKLVDNFLGDYLNGEQSEETTLVEKGVVNTGIVIGGIKGVVGEKVTTTTSSDYHHICLAVTPGDELTITTQRSTSKNYVNYAFVTDASDNIIKVAISDAVDSISYVTEDVVVPDGAAYIYVLSKRFYGDDQKSAFTVVLKGKTVQGFKDAVLSIVTENTTEPIAEIGEKILDEARLKIFEYNRSRKFLNFAWITDTHVNGVFETDDNNAWNNIELYVRLCKEKNVDFAIVGGDVYTAGGLTFADAIGVIDDAMAMFGESPIPVYFVKGNHDSNYKCRHVADPDNLDWENQTYYIWTNSKTYAPITRAEWDGKTRLYYGEEIDGSQNFSRSQWSMLYQNHIDVEFNPDDPTGGYFFKDFENEKVRIIVSNCFDEETELATWNGVQTKFIAEKALNFASKSNPAEWNVVFVAHLIKHGDMEGASQARWQIFNVLDCFVKGVDYTGVGIGGVVINANFSAQGAGNLVCTLHGHEHADTYDNENGWNNVGTDAGYGRGENIGTANEYAFDVFTIDTDDKILYDTRIGRGSDRSFSYATHEQIN